MTRRQFLVLILPLLALIVGFTVLWVLERTGIGGPPWDEQFAVYVRERMSREFVWGVGDEQRQKEAYFAALNAWARTFDPYAEVVPPWEVERSKVESSGQYTGVGVRTEGPAEGEPLEFVKIIGVKPGGPADKAGVKVGDRITAVDGRTLGDLGTQEALQNAIRGHPETTVRLRLEAPDGVSREAEVVRGRIDTGSVFGARYLDDERRVGYVRLQAFQASTAADLRHAIGELQKEGLRALVLDLRRNGGGLMDQALEIADLFLDDGVILQQRGRSGDYTVTYRANPEKTLSGTLALAVLINRNSASASEILAGALRDHRRAVLVGERTFGKFLVQMVEEVPTDFGVALFKRTTSIYETPLGHHYQRASSDPHEPDPLAGIVPDVYVPMTRAQKQDLYRVFADEFYADWNPAREPEVEDFHDPQLAAALTILKGEIFYPRLLAVADTADDG